MCYSHRFGRVIQVTMTLCCSASFSVLGQSPAETWQAANTIPGVDGEYHGTGIGSSAFWDPDGQGPLPPVWVVGGYFRAAGNTITRSVAAYNPQTQQWSSLGTGPNLWSARVVLSPSGELFAWGSVYATNVPPNSRISKWSGQTWVAQGFPSSSYYPTAMTVAPNGTIYAATDQTHVYQKQGTIWTQLGSVPANNLVTELAVTHNGTLIAAGSFTSIGGVTCQRIARWTGTTWSPLGGGVTGSDQYTSVKVLLPRQDGSLLVGGYFTNAGGVAVSNLAKWNGSQWESFTTGTNGSVNCITELPNEQFLVGGTFTLAGTLAANSIARWDGASWNQVGVGVSHTPVQSIPQGGSVNTIDVSPDGEYFVGGVFNRCGSTRALHAAKVSNSTWQSLGAGALSIPNDVVALLPAENGDLIATAKGEEDAFHRNAVWRRHDGNWSVIATSEYSPTSWGAHGPMLADGPGSFVVGGSYTSLNGVTARSIARLSPSGVTNFGAGLNGRVDSLTRSATGDIIVGGNFITSGNTPMYNIGRWTGSEWQPLGGGFNNTVNAVAVSPSGELIAGGDFGTTIDGQVVNRIARWNGTDWQTLDGGVFRSNGSSVGANISALCVLTNGEVVAAGTFDLACKTPAANIAAWNGTSWRSLSQEPIGFPVLAVHQRPHGELVAGGFGSSQFPGVRFIARLITDQWQPLADAHGEGLGVINESTPFVSSLASLPDGRLAVGGHFVRAGGIASPYVALWGQPPPTCDTIDFNNDTSLFDPQDIEAFLSVYSEGPCIPSTAMCNDIDFNNDTSVFDPCDINSFLVMYSEGPCTACGV